MEESSNTPEIEKMTYSQAIAELDNIVRTMQSDSCSIDNLNSMTERALKLLKHCKAKLTTTDEQLKEILTQFES